jgi:hypothetical protein
MQDDTDDGLDAFNQLLVERKPMIFMFYGVRYEKDPAKGAGYAKFAHSLSEALADLQNGAGVHQPDGGYVVRDAFIEEAEDDTATMHVELISMYEFMRLRLVGEPGDGQWRRLGRPDEDDNERSLPPDLPAA